MCNMMKFVHCTSSILISSVPEINENFDVVIAICL